MTRGSLRGRAGAGARRVGWALAALAFVADVAAGHAVLQRSEPRVESRLKRPPDEVTLYFSERLEPAYSAARVVNERGEQVDRRDSRVERANPTVLRVTLPPLPRGTYQVRWRVVAIDADVTEGAFTFQIE